MMVVSQANYHKYVRITAQEVRGSRESTIGKW